MHAIFIIHTCGEGGEEGKSANDKQKEKFDRFLIFSEKNFFDNFLRMNCF